MLLLGGDDTVEYAWLDRIQAVDPRTVDFQGTLIEPLDYKEAASNTTLVQQEIDTFNAIQKYFLKSKLFIGMDKEPYRPMLELMDATVVVGPSVHLFLEDWSHVFIGRKWLSCAQRCLMSAT